MSMEHHSSGHCRGHTGQNQLPEQKTDIHDVIKENFYRFSNNRQLADFLRIKIGTVRKTCYALGLMRLQLEYFTESQVQFLLDHYQKIGDCELAEIFQQRWPRNKPWSKKHIEKKRNYLGLRRTALQLRHIHQRNIEAGRFTVCPLKAWNKRGRAPEGEIRYWTHKMTGKKYPVIKHNGAFVHWNRWAWEQAYGKIPPKSNIVFRDDNPYNLTIDNLELLSNAGLAKRNAVGSLQALSDNYIAGILSPKNTALRAELKSNKSLLEIKRKQIILKRTIYEQQKN